MAKAAMVDVDPFISRMKQAKGILSRAINEGDDVSKSAASTTMTEAIQGYEAKAKIAKNCIPKKAPKAKPGARGKDKNTPA